MKKTEFLALLCLMVSLGVPSVVRATTYYVDGAGDDSHAGTSPATAWKTVNKVNQEIAEQLFQPGDSILFHGGETWRECITTESGTGASADCGMGGATFSSLAGTAAAPVTFGIYSASSGAAIINGSDLVTGWTAYSGSIYQASQSTAPHAVYADANFTAPTWPLTQASSLAGMQAGNWFYSSPTLYVWLADGSDPSGHNVEASTRISSFYANNGEGRYSHVTIDGLTLVRGYGYGIYFHDFTPGGSAGMPGMILRNNTVVQTGTGRVDDGSYYNAIHFLDEANTADGTTVMDNKLSYCGGHGNCIEIQGDIGNPLIVGNDVSVWNHNGIDVKAVVGALVRGNQMHNDRTDTFNGNPGNAGAGGYVQNASTDATNVPAASVTFRNNTVWNSSNGFQCEGNSGSTPTLTCNLYNNLVLTNPAPMPVTNPLVKGPQTGGLTVNTDMSSAHWDCSQCSPPTDF